MTMVHPDLVRRRRGAAGALLTDLLGRGHPLVGQERVLRHAGTPWLSSDGRREPSALSSSVQRARAAGEQRLLGDRLGGGERAHHLPADEGGELVDVDVEAAGPVEVANQPTVVSTA